MLYNLGFLPDRKKQLDTYIETKELIQPLNDDKGCFQQPRLRKID
jgi:hypothetical protein